MSVLEEMIVDGSPERGSTWSPTDLVGFVACERLAWLERAAERREIERPAPDDLARLTIEKGRAHEAAYRERLIAQGLTVADVAPGADAAGRQRAAAETFAHMRAGAEVIAGATFADGDFVGVADFIVRVAGASEFGAWHYEAVDVKLAGTAKTSAVLQLCAYTERIGFAQGVEPVHLHVVLGDGRTESFAFADFAAYYRAARARFLASVGPRNEPYPGKIAHCGRCRWSASCAERRRNDDHLSEVANIVRSQRRKLEEAGVTTMHALAALPDSAPVPRLARETFVRLRDQARLQCATRDGGPLAYAFLAAAPGRGFALLPDPDPADCFFDMEGDPFFAAGGLEYLFGVTLREPAGTGHRFAWFWGDDRAAEKQAFEDFMDFAIARWEAAPAMHIYHYANYEQAALIRLAGRHQTRGAELDRLFTAGVFVDLFAVTRQALQCSTDSYSIKAIERFYRPPRQAAVHDAMGSVLEYERYRATGDLELRAHILEYNRDDCESTLELDGWLRERRSEFLATGGTIVAAPPEPDVDAKKAAEREAARAEHAALVAALGDGPAEARLATLLDYHATEARPAWREFFARGERDPIELIDDEESIGGLVPVGEPERVKKSLVHRFTFPPQTSNLRLGKKCSAPGLSGEFTIEALDLAEGTIALKRGPKYGAEPLPVAVFGGKPVPDDVIRAALKRVARGLPEGRFAAVRALLERRRPQLRDGTPFAAPDGIAVERIAELADALVASALVVQGPPGSGKTFTAAHVAAELLARGRRIGIMARSHRAIHHLLAQIERTVHERGESFAGYVRTRDGESYDSAHGFITCGDEKLGAVGTALVAGTAWAFSSEDLVPEGLDVLLIDEAGQLALADAVAVSATARSVVLFGDPQQLPHVARATHAEGADVSALEHLLGDERTVSSERGVFLASTYRLEPDICGFISTLMYDGRLHPAAGRAHARILGPDARWSGSGLRAIPILHEDCGRESAEEATAIADAVATLLRGELERGGERRPIRQRDILAVAPYNRQVERIRAALDARGFTEVEAGTVDLFQGREAEVALFSLTSSSADDLPRGVAFAFSRNRLNVAISRARTIAALVYSPQMVALQSDEVDDIRMVNAVALLAERGLC
jgi:uncharacterized protein